MSILVVRVAAVAQTAGEVANAWLAAHVLASVAPRILSVDKALAGPPTVFLIESFCQRQGLRFSMIYWAANEPSLGPQQKSDPLNWRNGVLRPAAEYGMAGGRPGEFVLESWLQVPQHAVPESDPSTFTASVLALGQLLHLSGHSVGR